MLSFQGGVRVASYTASKSGLAGLTKLLANEWAPHGINVNAIAPGYFVTGQHHGVARRRETQRGDPRAHSGGPLGRPERSRRRRGVSCLSARSDYVHGVILPVDGGWLAR